MQEAVTERIVVEQPVDVRSPHLARRSDCAIGSPRVILIHRLAHMNFITAERRRIPQAGSPHHTTHCLLATHNSPDGQLAKAMHGAWTATALHSRGVVDRETQHLKPA